MMIIALLLEWIMNIDKVSGDRYEAGRETEKRL